MMKPKRSETRYQADAIVVGGGIAGITTALELLDNNKSVVLLDRDSDVYFGGQAITAFGGMLLTQTAEQKKSRVQDSKGLFLEDWLRFSDFDDTDIWPKKWAEFYCDCSDREVYQWVLDKGVKFMPQVMWSERGLYTPGNSLPRYHIIWGTGYYLTKVLIEHLLNHPLKDKLQVCFQHNVKELEYQNGSIHGCSGVIESTGKLFVAEGESVIIASGGIGGNMEQVRKNWFRELGNPPEKLFIGTHPFCDGRMHQKAEEAGGCVTNLEHFWNYPAGIAHPKPKFKDHGLCVIPLKSALWLNYQGRRIGPQPLIGYYDTRYLWQRICEEEKKYSWLILNKTIAVKELALSGAEHNPTIRDRNIIGVLKNILFGQKELVKEMLETSQDFLTANSLPELAEKMNALTGSTDIDVHGMTHDVSAYDAQIERGPALHNDDQLRRIAHFNAYRGDRIRTCNFQKIEDKKALPLIAIRAHILIRKSLGGIQTDLKCRVLNQQGEPIPGLFAVGEAAGFGGGGSNGKRSLEGLFVSNCILTGRTAGKAITENST